MLLIFPAMDGRTSTKGLSTHICHTGKCWSIEVPAWWTMNHATVQLFNMLHIFHTSPYILTFVRKCGFCGHSMDFFLSGQLCTNVPEISANHNVRYQVSFNEVTTHTKLATLLKVSSIMKIRNIGYKFSNQI